MLYREYPTHAKPVYRKMGEEACIFPGCDRPQSTRKHKLCATHTRHKLAGKELKPLRIHSPGLACKFPECDRVVLAKGLCYTHYKQLLRGAELTPIRTYDGEQGCITLGCDRPHQARGMCIKCYKRWIRELKTYRYD